jgi:S2P endopeptidase
MGAFFRFLYPGAYVELEQQELDSRAAWQKLKITGAGVWHNTVVSLFAALLLFFLPGALSGKGWCSFQATWQLPDLVVLLALLGGSYLHGEGVAVVEVHSASPLAGSLFPGDVLLRLGKV